MAQYAAKHPRTTISLNHPSLREELLRLGRITIQRKGGDAGKRTAGMLQFKFKPRDLFGIAGARVFESQAP